MKYKVGDKVRIKSIDWYNENKGNADKTNSVWCKEDGVWFFYHMSQYCGKIMTIENVWAYSYTLEGSDSRWTDEMIEGLVEEEVGLVDNFSSRRVNEFDLPEGYIFKDENGKVINATKIFLEKKKPKYPTTYIECAEILGFKPIHSLALQLVASHGFSIIDTQICAFERNLTIRLEYFRKLLICRDAYWKIAGEEMGLGKPWELSIGTPIYYIYYNRTLGTIKKDYADDIQGNVILAFPTEEMRDAFYENFKELINECKELL